MKIAAIEQRCHFRIPDPAIGHIGIEIGADAAASINLDDFSSLRIAPTSPSGSSANFSKARTGARGWEPRHRRRGVFRPVSERYIHSSPGVRGVCPVRGGCPSRRNQHNRYCSSASARQSDRCATCPGGCQTWYTRAKHQAVSTKPNAQELLNWIIDEVIQHRQARAFLLGSEEKDELIEFLYDARVLHVIRQGVSAQDLPGRRFNVYSLDYGCYVCFFIAECGGSPEPSFGRKLFGLGPCLDQRAVDREVFVGQQAPRYARIVENGGEGTCSRSPPPNSRSRFLVNTVTSHTGSSMPRPTNQRNNRL